MKQTKDQYRPLLEFGLDESEADAYLALVNLGRATIKELQAAVQDVRNWSYSQTYHILKKLLRVGVAEQQKGFEDTFTPLSPGQLFEQLRARKWERYAELEQELTENYERATAECGACTAQVNHFHFSTLELGFKILADRFISATQKSIHLISAPPSLFRRLQWALASAHERGVSIDVYYSKWDFEELPDYAATIQQYCRTYRTKLIRHQYRTHDPIAVNDEYTRQGLILLDRSTFISVPFFRYREDSLTGTVEHGIDYLEGFYKATGIGHNILEQLTENPILEEKDLIPVQEAQLMELVRLHSPLPKHELAAQLNVSGTELKSLLERLERAGQIRVEKVPKGRGRPADIVVLG